MMSAAENTVTAFLKSWAPSFDSLLGGFYRYMAPNSVWEQSGFPTCGSLEESVALIKHANKTFGMETIEVETRHILAARNTVICERMDYIRSPAGIRSVSVPVVGVFELNDAGQISAWRDYFDPGPFLELAKRK